ncbi:protein Wnt-8b [Lingula anatina]|uniref:Protein Wnt n=1 Tax=Lingula anatina TaxID=7574 RepID=A0A1S3IW20_LINAN|nr:protein Wnt-8b [Lingula anatina]|eukprot:XP_013402385.1 protein Wnt-8b [Lingula anatina]
MWTKTKSATQGHYFNVAVVFLLIIPVDVLAWSLNNFLMTGPKAYLTYADSVASGALMGVEECKEQFKWDRWNCPENTIPFFSHGSFKKADKETSFVHAISAAGVMYTLTRNCSMGHFENCGCDNSKKGLQGGPNWKWGGCSDNVNFGERISKLFVDSLETGKDALAIMNIHNNDAGRRAVRKTLKLTCKCHGVSGSCTTKTCWHQLPDFRDVGNWLKKKYQRAIRVDSINGELRNARRNQGLMSVSKNDLVYLEHSPNYCKANLTAGSFGTVGRECIKPRKKDKGSTRWERKSCRRLCTSCGLKVRKRYVEVTSSCNCKFQWCCSVKCETCRQKVVKFTCALR